jgi:hypothetical protein
MSAQDRQSIAHYTARTTADKVNAVPLARHVAGQRQNGRVVAAGCTALFSDQPQPARPLERFYLQLFGHLAAVHDPD